MQKAEMPAVSAASGSYPRSPALDGIRGILALTIAAYHLGLGSAVIGAWALSVDMFFLMSGYVIHQSCLRSYPGIGALFLRRVSRLGPLYLVALFASLLAVPRALPLNDVLANLLMIQPMIGYSSINGPSWSVSYELLLPLVAAPLFLAIRRNSAPVLFLAFAALAGIGAWYEASGAHVEAIRAIGGVGAGMALSRMGPVSLPYGTLWFGLLVILMMACAWVPVLALLFPLMCAGAVASNITTRGWLASHPMRSLGCWSYGIYLLHMPVTFTATEWLGAAVVGHWAGKLGLLAATVLLSAAAYRWVERPLLYGPRKDELDVSVARRLPEIKPDRLIVGRVTAERHRVGLELVGQRKVGEAGAETPSDIVCPGDLNTQRVARSAGAAR